MASPSPTKIEMIKQTIKQMMEEVGSDDDDDRHRHRLSQLISQLERLEDDADNITRLNEEDERILKELKNLRRQNVITHWLLSIMIVLTVVWQISEVSIILRLKDGVAHPIRSVGRIVKAMIKPRRSKDDLLREASSVTSDLIESTPVRDLKLPLPNLPRIDLGFHAQD